MTNLAEAFSSRYFPVTDPHVHEYFRSGTFVLAAERIADYIRASTDAEFTSAVEAIFSLSPQDLAASQMHVHLLLVSLYERNGDENRKADYRALYDAINATRGGRFFPIRHEIDEVIHSKGIESIADFDQIKVIERVEDRPVGEDCFQYAFGFSTGDSFEKWWDRNKGLYSSLTGPQDGAIVLYANDLTGAIMHAGKIVSVGQGFQVVSKWGEKSPVLQHPLYHVPNVYGALEEIVIPKTSR